MTTRLFEDRPETVWALLTEAAATPTWLGGRDVLPDAAVDAPVWPEPGARLTYRSGRGRRRGIWTVRVLDLQPGRRFEVALSRRRRGGVPPRAGNTVVVGVRLEPAPVFRTAVTVESSRFPIHHLRPGGRDRISGRAAQRVLTDLVTELRHRGPVMARPRDWTGTATPTRR